MDMTTSTLIPTSGGGLWSSVPKLVRLTRVEIDHFDDKDADPWGEMRVYFDTSTWDVAQDGLIYTDPLFEAELTKLFESRGLAANDWFGYSEQGMQGGNYVSFDIGGKLLQQFMTQVVDKNG